ncbi:MAG: glycogen synthase GlgA, partial [Deltaproteobacteria bacterium]|nr:glycogen synthase GlgA [Deltaproteobacteria bacterium]
MKIIFASPEAVPFVKTGGLADVSGSLPKALAQLGHEVILILPKYRQIQEKFFNLKKVATELGVPISQRVEKAEIYEGEMAPNCKILFIRKDDYYDRDQLYGTPNGDFEDNAERFTFFSRAVIETVLAMDLRPDILHCHDWQTGLIPVYQKTIYRFSSSLTSAASVFTIHNIAYQGLFWHYDLQLTNLDWKLFTPQALEFYGKLNFLKGGIVFADAVTTVSQKYMEEIQTPEFGAGLDGVLRNRREDFYGILNGVDYQEWSPESDPHLGARYSATDLRGKKVCKADLQQIFGLPVKEKVPLLGIISRLTEHKGFDLLAGIMDKLMQLDLQLVILGTGDEKYHLLLENLQGKYPQQLGVKISFDNNLAHKIEAGADFFLMPSRFEPCGLNQIYSLRYGTVPVVRATGGLDDTIQDINFTPGEGNGFKFQEYTAAALLAAIQRALQVYQNPDLWKQ